MSFPLRMRLPTHFEKTQGIPAFLLKAHGDSSESYACSICSLHCN